jgi:hypothetical protein
MNGGFAGDLPGLTADQRMKYRLGARQPDDGEWITSLSYRQPWAETKRAASINLRRRLAVIWSTTGRTHWMEEFDGD